MELDPPQQAAEGGLAEALRRAAVVDQEVKTEVKEEVKDEEPGGAAAAADDDDDPVVAEYDVYLANRLLDNLHLFQFPLRPPERPYNLDHVTSMRMQQTSRRFNLNLDPNKQSQQLQAELFGDPSQQQVQEQGKSRGQPFVLDSRRVRNKTNYAVGVVRSNMLHMTGLQNIHQFRPNLQANLELNPDRQSMAEDAAKAEAAEEERMTATQRAKSEMQMKQFENRMRSVWLTQVEQETWTDLGLSTANNPESKKGILERLFAPSDPMPLNPKHTTPLYLSQLFKKTKDGYLKEPNAKIPLALATEYDWKLQVESLALSARVLRFGNLRMLLQKQQGKELPSDGELLAHVETCCVVIRGLLIIKAHPSIPANSPTAFAREWILLKLWENRDLRRAVITEPPFALPLSDESVKKLLEDVAVLKPHADPAKRVWQLRGGNEDASFCEAHASFCARSDAAWLNDRASAITANVQGAKQSGRVPRQVFAWEGGKAAQEAQKPGAGQSHNIAYMWLLKMFERTGVWNRAVLVAKFKDAQKRNPNTVIPDDVFMKVLSTITAPFNDGIVLKNLSRNKAAPLEIDQFRPIIIKLFTDQQSWERKDLEPKIADIPKQHATMILKEIAVFNNSTYSARPGALK
ncbi:DNA-directed RNA polymerase III subunit rpc5 [Diplonema papillatum]|nr:DNA-directed RNA polymerase III subunit rpc5 [Diplonema papillatum]|eukprot:gene3440-5387_t